MKTFNKKLLEKFFKGTCTPDEAEQVLDWLETVEGQSYLDERLENEINEWDEEECKPTKQSSNKDDARFGDTPDLQMLFEHIICRLGWQREPHHRKPMIQVVSMLCVIVSASVFYFYSENGALKGEADFPVVFSSLIAQKKITLRDESVMRLNKSFTGTTKSKHLTKIEH